MCRRKESLPLTASLGKVIFGVSFAFPSLCALLTWGRILPRLKVKARVLLGTGCSGSPGSVTVLWATSHRKWLINRRQIRWEMGLVYGSFRTV